MNKIKFKETIIKQRNSNLNFNIFNSCIWSILFINKFHEGKYIFSTVMLVLVSIILIPSIIQKIKLKKIYDTTYVDVQNDRVLIRKDLLSKQKTIILDDINYIDIGEKKIKVKTNNDEKFSIRYDFVDTIDAAELKYLFKKFKEYLLDKSNLKAVK